MYGIIVSLGILSSLLVGERIAIDKKLDTNVFWSSSLWAIVGGVVGARLYHVVDYIEIYAKNPIAILFIHHGGLGIYGALIGGAIGFITYLTMTNKDVWEYLDVFAIVIPLGQAIGRWGNFANMEILGKPTHLPWGMHVPLASRPPHLIYNDVYHPIFLYESLLDILLFFVLLLLYQRKNMLKKSKPEHKPLYALKGFFTLTYLVGYGTVRFSLEFIRLGSWYISGVNVAQGFSFLFISIGILGLFLLNKHRSS